MSEHSQTQLDESGVSVEAQESMDDYLRRALPAGAAQWVIAEIERLRANQRTGRIVHGDADAD